MHTTCLRQTCICWCCRQRNPRAARPKIMPALMLPPWRMKLSGQKVATGGTWILPVRRGVLTGLKLARFSEHGPANLDSLLRPRRNSRRIRTNVARLPCSAERRNMRRGGNESFATTPYFMLCMLTPSTFLVCGTEISIHRKAGVRRGQRIANTPTT